MQVVQSKTKAHRKTLGFVGFVALITLLIWQLSFKVNQFDKAYAAVTQSVIDATEPGLDNQSDLDYFLPVSLFEVAELNGWLEHSLAKLIQPFSRIFIPQSRAPPATL